MAHPQFDVSKLGNRETQAIFADFVSWCACVKAHNGWIQSASAAGLDTDPHFQISAGHEAYRDLFNTFAQRVQALQDDPGVENVSPSTAEIVRSLARGP